MEIQDIRERLHRILSPFRYRHSLATQKVAVDLAHYYNLDTARASLAAFLHDCGKGFSTREAESYIEKYGVRLDAIEKEEPELWHGPIGEEMAKHEFGIKDSVVLRAIRIHSTAEGRMSTIAKIVYIADYLEPNRHLKGKGQIIKFAFKDLDLACLYVLNHKLSYILHKKVFVHPRSIEARNNLLKTIRPLKENL
ncbi:TPA: hypothetical protein DCX15_01880 [bacterium]|nr:hypothetical protein [bacterium]